MSKEIWWHEIFCKRNTRVSLFISCYFLPLNILARNESSLGREDRGEHCQSGEYLADGVKDAITSNEARVREE